MPDRHKITETILQLRSWYKHERDMTPIWINHGYCHEFAEDLQERFPEATLYYTKSGPLTPYHWFIKIDGRYYDAEAPEGVMRIQDLPTFRRSNSKAFNLERFLP